MSFQLSIIRKLKALFIRLRLHLVFEPFSKLLLNLVHLSGISQWVHSHPKIAFNDFYSSNWNYLKRYDLYQYLLSNHGMDKPMLYLEFGVAAGHSFSWWVQNNKHPESRFHGFDTFEGLPEEWGIFKAGDMSTGSKFPDIQDDRVRFYKGLFQKTVPLFLKDADWNLPKLIHMDADLYSSTLYVLTMLAPYLKAGDIVMFDEFTVPRHEYLAFKNFRESYYLDFELIAAANNYFFVAFRMK